MLRPQNIQQVPLKRQKSQQSRLVTEFVEERRRNRIYERSVHEKEVHMAREEKLAHKAKLTSTKYPKQDVLLLKQVFDDYDYDRSGSISMSELKRELKRQKANVQRYDGRKLTLSERQAMAGRRSGQSVNDSGAFLLNYADSLFRALDLNGDGRVSFKEILQMIFPLATLAEIGTMVAWVTPEAHGEGAPSSALSPDQEREARTMFRLYDADNSGAISKAEFKSAMRQCGFEVGQLFDTADKNANQHLEYDEFRELIRETGLYSSRPLLIRPVSPTRPVREARVRASTCLPSPTWRKPSASCGSEVIIAGSPSAGFLAKFGTR